jgi:hypothetical protein
MAVRVCIKTAPCFSDDVKPRDREIKVLAHDNLNPIATQKKLQHSMVEPNSQAAANYSRGATKHSVSAKFR